MTQTLPKTGTVDVDGAAIRWHAGGAGAPALVFVHGGSAHAAWWEPTLAALDPGRRVVTLDLSGHGDSGRRARYPTISWADEVAAVVRAAAGGRAVLVAHSLGGRVASVCAARHPEVVEALILVDCAIPAEPDDPVPPVRPARVHATPEDAMRKFRLLPGQPLPPAAIMEHIVRTSVAPSDGGWSWKFDPQIFGDLIDDTVERHLGGIACPVVAVNGELSDLSSPALTDRLAREHLHRPVPLVMIPGAHHHVLLDDPVALAQVLDWLPETRVQA